MKQAVILLLMTILLSGCKLGGEAVNISKPVTIQETVIGESLTLTMDGTFSFQHEFEPDDAYKVEIIEQPAGLVCSVENASGVFGEEDISSLVVSCEDDLIFCPLHYDPVCAKKQSNIACVTEPCATHQYRTFSNSCFASAERGMTAFKGDCDGLQEAVAFSGLPVHMISSVLSGETGDTYEILESNIKDNQLSLKLQYSGGCAEHDFRLEAEQKYSQSDKVRVNVQVVHTSDDACDGLISSEVQFDLLPIKEFYRRQFGEGSGEVELNGLGVYRF